MPRLKLKPKKPQLKIKPKIEKGMKIGRTIVESPVINHDDSAFPFLEFFDPMTMKVSRVDRYSINLFHSPRKREDGIMMYDTELIFYPSGPGMEQIESFANDDTIITFKIGENAHSKGCCSSLSDCSTVIKIFSCIIQ